MTDSQLITRWRDGDEAAFHRLYERYRRPLYAYLNRLVSGDHALADDLYQQTWVRALDRLDRYQERDRFLSWLFRIAHNLAVDTFRRSGVRKEEEVPDTLPDDAESTSERIDRDLISKALEDAILSLNAEQREVVELRRNGVPFKEIAQIQDVSINTVLGRMHYAVTHLRTALKPLRPAP